MTNPRPQATGWGPARCEFSLLRAAAGAELAVWASGPRSKCKPKKMVVAGQAGGRRPGPWPGGHAVPGEDPALSARRSPDVVASGEVDANIGGGTLAQGRRDAVGAQSGRRVFTAGREKGRVVLLAGVFLLTTLTLAQPALSLTDLRLGVEPSPRKLRDLHGRAFPRSGLSRTRDPAIMLRLRGGEAATPLL